MGSTEDGDFNHNNHILGQETRYSETKYSADAQTPQRQVAQLRGRKLKIDDR
jgi:predicted nucleotidyltransferase